MKKALKAFFSVVIMLTLAVCTATAVNAASTNKNSVYKFLTEDIGFNSAAACGIMANIEHESNFDSSKVIRDSNGLLSGGLCQWNGSRFSNLKSFCNRNGYNYLSISGQLKYLESELKKSNYKHIYNYLKNVSNTAQGAYDAAYYWCYYFEVPASRSSKSVKRGNSAKNAYWPVYGNTKLSKVKLESKSDDKTIDMDDSVTLTWSSAGNGAENYTVYLAKKTDGNYNWDTAKKTVVSKTERKLTINLNGTEPGTYKALVKAAGSTSSTKSNTVKFYVKCLKHNYSSKVTKKATETSKGVMEYTCQKCGHKYQKSFSRIINVNETALKSISLSVSGASTGVIKLRCSNLKNADGYEVYKYTGKKWVKAATSEKKNVSLSNLKSGKTYKLKYRAYYNNSGVTEYGSFTSLNVATAPKSTYLKSIFRPAVGTVSINWNAVDGASGYIIYMSNEKSGKYKKVKAVASSTATNCKISGLKTDEYYYFKIKAYRKAKDNTAYSDFSNIRYVISK